MRNKYVNFSVLVGPFKHVKVEGGQQADVSIED